MAQSIHVTKQPVTLEGYQAVMKPSKFGFSLSALVGSELIEALEEDRATGLKWCDSKLKNPKRSVLRPEPWEEVSAGQYKIKFSWNEETKPSVVDTEGTLITDPNTPIYSGSQVKLAFRQKPYVLNDGSIYGTSLKLVGVQVVALSASAGVDRGDMSDTEVAELFGTTRGFKTQDPNVTAPEKIATDDDF